MDEFNKRKQDIEGYYTKSVDEWILSHFSILICGALFSENVKKWNFKRHWEIEEWTVNQSINQSMHHNQPDNQAINQSINRNAASQNTHWFFWSPSGEFSMFLFFGQICLLSICCRARKNRLEVEAELKARAVGISKADVDQAIKDEANAKEKLDEILREEKVM